MIRQLLRRFVLGQLSDCVVQAQLLLQTVVKQQTKLERNPLQSNPSFYFDRARVSHATIPDKDTEKNNSH